MFYRPLGNSGIDASVIGFGAWAIGGWMWGGTDKKAAIKAIHAAIDAGVNLVDTAPVYGFGLSEEIVGEAIRDRRNRVLLATKCGLVWHLEEGQHFFNSDKSAIRDQAALKVYRYLGPTSIRYEVEESLRRLKIDVIDLYQTHWQEPTTPIAETMEVLLQLKQEGKIRAIGVSNVNLKQLQEYQKSGQVDSAQERYNMLDRQKESDILPYCATHPVAFLAYSPIAQGLLTGKVGPDRQFGKDDQRNGNPRFSLENRKIIASMLEQFSPIAEAHQITTGQLVIAWTLAQPGCSHALLGARTAEQAIENAQAGAVQLTENEISQITQILEKFKDKFKA